MEEACDWNVKGPPLISGFPALFERMPFSGETKTKMARPRETSGSRDRL
jgi:hypothetical protein